MLAQQVLNHWTIIPVLEGGVILSFKSPKKGQKMKVITQVFFLMLKACQKVVQSPRQERWAAMLLEWEGGSSLQVECVLSSNTFTPQVTFSIWWNVTPQIQQCWNPQSKVHLPNTSSGDRQLTRNLTQVTALWSREQSQLLTLLSKQSVRGARETVGNSLYICCLSCAHLKFLQFVLILHYTSPHCHLHTNSLLLATSMCTWHSQLDAVEIKSGKLQLELSLQEEIDSIFIWNIHTTNYTFIFKTMHTPQNIQTYFHQHICPSKVNSYVLHLYIHLFVHPLTNLPIHSLTHSSSMHPSSLHQLIYPRIH